MHTVNSSKLPKEKKVRQLGILSLFSVTLFFLLATVFGHLFGWMNNALCFQYLGCNAGFFGYDALVHCIAGVTVALLLTWVAQKNPQYNFFSDSFWKNCVIVIALVALIGVGWEVMEYTSDQIRFGAFHRIMTRLTHNLYAQPSNADTMGDLCADIVGAFIIVPILKWLPDEHKKRT
jgi:hypothetical protein